MAEPVVHGPGAGRASADAIGAQVVFKARGEQSGGTLTAFETTVPAGLGPPLHVHAEMEETIYVLEGEFRFKLGDESHAGPTGSFACIPRGVPHSWQNVGDGLGRILIHITPAGMERFFDAFEAIEDPQPQDFARVGKEVGMEVLGPPLAESDPL
jgi:quercetin dioxygenase-like cupin family protein